MEYNEYMSEEIGEIAGALSTAQGSFKTIERKCVNPFFKSKYADLAAINDGTKVALKDNNLAVTQVIIPDDEKAIVESRLLHKSGQWIISTCKLKPKATDPQSMGSAITYARRYSLSALLNIATEDEEDGNSASATQKKAPLKQERSQPQQEHNPFLDEEPKPTGQVPMQEGIPAPITQAQMRAIQTMLGKMEIDDDYARHEKVARILGLDNVPASMSSLTKDQASKVISALSEEAK